MWKPLVLTLALASFVGDAVDLSLLKESQALFQTLQQGEGDPADSPQWGNLACSLFFELKDLVPDDEEKSLQEETEGAGESFQDAIFALASVKACEFLHGRETEKIPLQNSGSPSNSTCEKGPLKDLLQGRLKTWVLILRGTQEAREEMNALIEGPSEPMEKEDHCLLHYSYWIRDPHSAPLPEDVAAALENEGLRFGPFKLRNNTSHSLEVLVINQGLYNQLVNRPF